MRIPFSAFGFRSIRVPAYAVVPDDLAQLAGASQAVAEAIARANGLRVLTLREDGQDVDRHGATVASWYALTLGRTVKGGRGLSEIVAQGRFAIERTKPGA